MTHGSFKITLGVAIPLTQFPLCLRTTSSLPSKASLNFLCDAHAPAIRFILDCAITAKMAPRNETFLLGLAF